MADKVVLVMARRGGEYVAGAFNILGRETIYGRNWGSYGDYQFLHFECCYYRAIEFAIDHGLKRVEAGAQGPHKLQRGYLPVPIYSAHCIPDPNFRRAVAQFLAREREMVAQKIEHLAEIFAVPPRGGRWRDAPRSSPSYSTSAGSCGSTSGASGVSAPASRGR